MIQRLLFFLFIFLSFSVYSQIQGPPPCGYTPAYACDDDNDGFAVFNLVDSFSFVTFCRIDKGEPEEYHSIVYYMTREDMVNETNPIVNPESYLNISDPQIIYYRANKIVPDNIEFLTGENPMEVKRLSSSIQPLSDCDTDYDGLAVFDLTGIEANLFCGSVPNNYSVSYHESFADANSLSNMISLAYTSGSRTIFARVEYLDAGYVEIASFELVVWSIPVMSQPTDLIVCDEDDSPDGYAIIDLTQKDDEIINGQSNLIVSYHYNQMDANLGNNPIPYPYINTNTPTDVVYIRVVNSLTGCVNTDNTLSINVIVSPIVNRDTQYMNACDKDLDGMATFDLTQVLNDILMGLTGITSTFHENYNDATFGANPITNTTNYQNTNLEEQSIYVRIEDNTTGCASIVPLEIHTNLLLTGTGLGDFALCDTNDDDSDTLEFNLTSVESFISNDLPNPVAVTFYETEADRDSSINPIPKGVLYSAISPKVLYVDLDDGNCPEVGEITLLVRPILLFNPADPIPYCDIDGDGIANIDLHSLDDIVTGGNADFMVSYFSTNIDAHNNINKLPLVYTNTSSLETIYARVGSILSGCASVNSFDLVVQDCRDQDNDSVINNDEDINGNGNLDDDDTDGDTIPDYMDDDDDGDKIDTADELIDQNVISKSSSNFKISILFIDTDNDTIENYLDNDDDDDGILTKDEDYNNNGTPLDDDTNSNNIPDYLEKIVALGITDFELSNFAIFPNPARDIVELKFNKSISDEINISVYNIQGKLILNSKRVLQNRATEINVSSLKSGMYFLKVNDGVNGVTQKLIIE